MVWSAMVATMSSSGLAPGLEPGGGLGSKFHHLVVATTSSGLEPNQWFGGVPAVIPEMVATILRVHSFFSKNG